MYKSGALRSCLAGWYLLVPLSCITSLLNYLEPYVLGISYLAHLQQPQPSPPTLPLSLQTCNSRSTDLIWDSGIGPFFQKWKKKHEQLLGNCIHNGKTTEWCEIQLVNSWIYICMFHFLPGQWKWKVITRSQTTEWALLYRNCRAKCWSRLPQQQGNAHPGSFLGFCLKKKKQQHTILRTDSKQVLHCTTR